MLSFHFVEGTAPGKWMDRFSTRTHWGLDSAVCEDPLDDVLHGRCLLGLVRLPDTRISDDLHVVRLYEEEPGVAVSRDSLYAELGQERLSMADLEGEILNYRIADSGSVDIQKVREALQIVAANVGVCIAPRPLLRALSKKRIAVLGLEGASFPVTQITLVWLKSNDCEMIQDFVGIAKGRRPASSRGFLARTTTSEKTQNSTAHSRTCRGRGRGGHQTVGTQRAQSHGRGRKAGRRRRRTF